MDIGSLGIGPLQGIQRGFNGLNANAAKIASATQMNGPDTAAPAAKPSLERVLVGLQQNSQDVQASAKALSVEDKMLGTLLDVMA
jgi:hypothetical protein